MKHISTYLKRLKFDNNLSSSIISKYFNNLRLISLIVIGIIIFGLISFNKLPRNLYPDVNIPTIIITTVLPGANPQDIESLVTIPIEDSVNGVSDVKKVTSSSNESVSVVSVELESKANIDKAKSDIQSAVDAITKLPDNAQKPTILKIDLQKTPIWTFAIAGGNDEASLINFSKNLKQKLTDLPDIDSISTSGLDDQEIQIVIDPEKISKYSVNPQVIMGAVKTSLNSFPAGNVNTQSSTFSLTINQQTQSIEDIRNLKINLDNQIVSLSDVADIFEKSKPNQFPTFLGIQKSNNLPTIVFNVYRTTTVNIGVANKSAHDLINTELKNEKGTFKIYNIADYAQQIEDQFSHLQNDLITTIILVSLVLFIFLGIRQSFVSLISTPLTFLISFIVMDLTGVTLNFISVFALILSLGLLVDDTIVVASAITAYYRSGKFNPKQTGLLVYRDFIVAILTTTTTTIWAFLPILVSAGIIGEFIKPIPIVVSTILAGSFFVAIFLTLPFMVFLLKPNFPKRVVILGRVMLIILGLLILNLILPNNSLKFFQILSFIGLTLTVFVIRNNIRQFIKTRNKFKISKKTKLKIADYMEYGVLSLSKIEYYYKGFIYKILVSKTAKKKIIIMVVIFSIFSYLLVPLGFVKNEFFPKDNSETLSVSVELPAGTNIETSKTEALQILNKIKNTPNTKYVLLNLGGGGGNSFGFSSASENVFNLTLILEDKHDRKLTSSDIAEIVRENFKSYNKGVFSVSEASGGPPAGSDLDIKIFGSDLAILDSYANKISTYLKQQPEITNVDKSIKPGTSKIIFTPNTEKISQNNLTTDSIGFWLRLFATGIKIDSIKLDKDLNTSEDITLRMYSKTPSANDISNLYIPTKNGQLPITSLGTLNLKPNPTLITREDGKRTISVTASVKKGFTVPQVNKKVEDFAKTKLNLPAGYSWSTGGVNQQNQESVGSIYQAMLISIILIVITMVLQFNSFRRALIVITVIPFSVSGVFIIFALTNTALSFPALVGVLALFGIVVKNSILVMDKILANINSGMEFAESIADAAASRLEPIALTSITAIVGLIPITLSDPLWRGLGGAIIAGLTFSGTIMLFFIPVIYYIVYKPKK